MATSTSQTSRTATTDSTAFAHSPVVRLINIFFSFLLLTTVLLFSNTALVTWAVFLISVPAAGILTVSERWFYNDLFAPKP